MAFQPQRVNVFDDDIRFRFGEHVSTLYLPSQEIFIAKTAFLIQWLDRDVLQLTMQIPQEMLLVIRSHRNVY